MLQCGCVVGVMFLSVVQPGRFALDVEQGHIAWVCIEYVIHCMMILLLQSRDCQRLDWPEHRKICSLQAKDVGKTRALDFAHTYSRILITIAANGLGLNDIRGFPDPSSSWEQLIRRKGYLFHLKLSREFSQPPYRSLDFTSSQPVDLEDLEVILPGVLEDISHRIQIKKETPLAVLFVTANMDGSLVDFTTITYSFNINQPCSIIAVEDAEHRLRKQIRSKTKC